MSGKKSPMAVTALSLSVIAIVLTGSATVWGFLDTSCEKSAPMISVLGAGQPSDSPSMFGLFINEVMADNDAAVMGPNGTYPDWVELYNAGNATVNLSGMYLTDDLADPTKWKFPNGISIAARGHLLIWSNSYVGEGTLRLSFALKANGETLAIFASDGETLIDTVLLGKQLRDVSTGRCPDGSTQWDYFTIPTPGSANITSPLPATPIWPAVLFMASIVAIVAAAILVKKEARGKQS